MWYMEARVSSKTSPCEACGDFPVNHFLTYIDKTIAVWEHDWILSRGERGVLSRFSKALRAQAIILGPHLIRVLHILCGGETRTEPTFACVPRAYAMWQEAQRRHMKMEQLLLFGSAIDSYRVRIKNRWRYFESLPIPPEREVRSFEWADDKLLFKQFLKRHAIPVAEARVATSLTDAHKMRTELHMPVVVKPRLGSNSRHTTLFVQTSAQFDDAFALAQQLCRYVLFEEHLYGHLCRATVVDGRLVGFLESRQPTVTGDGVQTIRALVAEKNAHKHERVADVVLTEENQAHIYRQGHGLDSIPKHGVVLGVSRLPGRLMGGQTREMLEEVHPKLRQYVEKAATLLRAPLVGFDLIIPDAAADPDDQTWGILEANTVPFIEIHNDPLYGKPSNVASPVWDLWK